MSSIQIRLSSLLSFGKTRIIGVRFDCFYPTGYTTSIRSIHLSPVLINNTAVISRNEQHIKQIFTSLEKRSIICSSTSLIETALTKSQSIWQRIVHESKHYYHGCKLLFLETKIAFRLGRQMLNGHTLTRRERKQLTRTMVDLLRLIPFSVFIIVPFMEFTLPIFLKLFPNMLPSTFKQIKKERDTSNEMIKSSDTQSLITLANPPMLNNLPRSQLIDLCKLFHLSSMGPHFYLRWKLQHKFYRLKIDDNLIVKEGLGNLTDDELRSACHERGMISSGNDTELLQSWLNLHVPAINDRRALKIEKPKKIIHTKIDLKNEYPSFLPIGHLQYRSAQVRSKHVDDLVVHLSQSSHHQQRMY